MPQNIATGIYTFSTARSSTVHSRQASCMYVDDVGIGFSDYAHGVSWIFT
jgi:hypothetical protein